MANLNKLLVHVPSNLCDDFKGKYINPPKDTARDESYDSKIVFLEKTQEIFAKGKIYSTSVLDFSSLQELVNSLKGLVGDKLPEGVTSNNVIDYIGEVKNELIGEEGDNPYVNTIQSAKTLARTFRNDLIGLDGDSYVEDTIYGAKAYAIHKDKKIYTDVVSYLLGNPGDLSSYNTIYGAKKYADEEVSKVAANLPTVSQGTGITVTPTTYANGKINYEISTYPDIFHYKGNVTTTSALPSTGNIKGDVWSVGADKAAGSVLYAWDGDEWINIGSPNSVTGVNTTSSHGVSLSRTTDGRVQVNVAPGSVVKNETSVVTGGQVWSEMINKLEIIDSYNMSYLSFKSFYDNEHGKSYMAYLDEQAIFNYVSENFWETYKV